MKIIFLFYYFIFSVCIVSGLLVDCFVSYSWCIFIWLEVILCLYYLILVGEELGSIFEEVDYSVVDSVVFDFGFDLVDDDFIVDVLMGDDFKKLLGKYGKR